MKRFFVSVLCVSIFFLGLGTLIEKASARFKSDEKALALIKAARNAVGGDNAVAGIQSLRIKGATTHTFRIDGTDRTESGETEIAIQLPDKLSKMVKFGKDDGGGADQLMVKRQVDVVVVTKDKDGNDIVPGPETSGVKKIIVKKGDGSDEELRNENGDRIIVRKMKSDEPLKVEGGQVEKFRVNSDEMETHHRQAQQNELFRLTLGLLLSPPASLPVNYTFGGEVAVADTQCNLVIAELAGSTVKLYLDRSSNLPVQMTYSGEQMPMIMHFNKRVDAPDNGDKNVVFFRKTDAPASSEFTVRFSDYRAVNGVQLPYRWITTAGDMREVFDVSSYEVNPANIGDAFQQPKFLVRTKKEGN
jgi:hypothetical protein